MKPAPLPLLPLLSRLAAIWHSLPTLTIGAGGAAAAYALGLPASVLIGSALAVSAAGLAGARVRLADPLRDLCFLALGIGVGTGFTAEAGGAILRWPLAFVALLGMLLAILFLGRRLLERGFGFDRRSAALAAAPGHLSFVLGYAAQIGGDVGRVAVVQSIRLLALTVAVPFVALALGYRMGAAALPEGAPMATGALLALAFLGLALGLGLKRLGVPAPLLLGPMIASALGHVTDLTPGNLPEWLAVPAFLGLGTLIGTRFSGMRFAQFRALLLAGMLVTAISVLLAGAIALPLARWLGMPAAHVLTAFAPGGLETMVALGATLGANPGFIAACHVMRLLMLSVLIPLVMGRAAPVAAAAAAPEAEQAPEPGPRG